jgi:hypothetical protein
MHPSITAVPANAADAPAGTDTDVMRLLPGLWRLAVRMQDGGFEAMITFSPAGALVEIAAPRAEPSLGLWTAQPEGRFTFVMHAFVHTNPPGQPAVTIHSVRAACAMTGADTFEGTATLTFSDAKDHAVIFTAEPSFTGIRMTA